MATPSIATRESERETGSVENDALINPYTTRYATTSDAVSIDHIVREAFGSSAPKSSTAREMKRPHTTYIVATKTNGANGGSNTGFNGDNGGWVSRFRSAFSASIGSLEPQKAVSNIVGLVGLWTAVDQAHVVVIATKPSERGNGVGELLLIATAWEAMKVGAANVTLEVRKSNLVARALYRKYGFADVGIRHRYYHDNQEDAIIMSTPSFSDLNYRRSLQNRCETYFAARGRTDSQLDSWPQLALPE